MASWFLKKPATQAGISAARGSSAHMRSHGAALRGVCRLNAGSVLVLLLCLAGKYPALARQSEVISSDYGPKKPMDAANDAAMPRPMREHVAALEAQGCGPGHETVQRYRGGARFSPASPQDPLSAFGPGEIVAAVTGEALSLGPTLITPGAGSTERNIQIRLSKVIFRARLFPPLSAGSVIVVRADGGFAMSNYGDCVETAGPGIRVLAGNQYIVFLSPGNPAGGIIRGLWFEIEADGSVFPLHPPFRASGSPLLRSATEFEAAIAARWAQIGGQ